MNRTTFSWNVKVYNKHTSRRADDAVGHNSRVLEHQVVHREVELVARIVVEGRRLRVSARVEVDDVAILDDMRDP